jgi:hypothetical protein
MRVHTLSRALLVFVGLVAFLADQPSALARLVFTEYSGTWREWPISISSMTEIGFAVPVYRTWPDRNYEVVGSLKYTNRNKSWENDEIREVAKEAMKRGGNAIILRFGAEAGVGGVASSGAGRIVYNTGETTALVIRVLSDRELRERDEEMKELIRAVLTANPTAAYSEETGALVFKYLLQSGEKRGTDEFRKKFSAVMTEVSVEDSSSFSGAWIFKASVKTGRLVGTDEESFFGLATVKSEGTSLAIVSTKGTTEMNFAGSLAENRIEGQLGVAGLSAKAEGVAISEKISISFRSLTHAGTAEGTLVLQRAAVLKPQPPGSTKKEPSKA